MVNQSPNRGSGSILDKLIAVALVFWLLFGGGITTLKAILTPARVSQVAGAIQSGAGRVIAPNAAPAARLPQAVPRSSGAPAAPAVPTADNAQIQAAADAAYQATAQASLARGNVASAPAAPAGALPTAIVRVPTAIPVEQVRVVPQSMPVLAQSGPIVPTAIPTMAYPTPLPPAVLGGYTLSADGTCITVTRDGKQYQDCEGHQFTLGEARSVADLMRTGRIPGVPVQ